MNLRTIRLAKLLCEEEDGREWEQITADAQDRYLEQAKRLLTRPLSEPENDDGAVTNE